MRKWDERERFSVRMRECTQVTMDLTVGHSAIRVSKLVVYMVETWVGYDIYWPLFYIMISYK